MIEAISAIFIDQADQILWQRKEGISRLDLCSSVEQILKLVT